MRMKAGIVAAVMIVAIAQVGQPQAVAAQARETIPPELFGALQYRMVGPSRGGRVTAVSGHRAQPSFRKLSGQDERYTAVTKTTLGMEPPSCRRRLQEPASGSRAQQLRARLG